MSSAISAARHRLRLKYLATLNPPVPSRIADDLEVSFLPMEAIGEDGSLDLSRRRPAREVRSSYSYFADGDVAYAKVTPCFENGKGAVMRGLASGHGFGTTELTILRPTKAAHAGFLNYVLISQPFRQGGAGAMTGAGGLKRVPDEFAANFVVALPSMDEQVSVVAQLDDETARIDALIEKKTRFIELLREKRQALITQTVTQGLDPSVPMKDSGLEWLGRVPAHWEILPISLLCEKITNGFVGPTRDILVDSGVRYLQSLHIKNNAIKFDDQYFVTPEWSEQRQKSVLRAGDVLIVQTGDIGQVACVTSAHEGCNCHALIIVSPKRSVITGPWLTWVLASSYGQDSLLSIQTGAMHPHLNCGNVRNIQIPVPPLSEQQRWIDQIERRTEQIGRAVDMTERSVSLLRERRSALITAAVTGQIDLREAA